MTGGVWITAFALLWLTVLVLGVVVVALLRQVGVLHARLRPLGVHFGGEGPERLAPAPPLPGHDYAGAGLTLVVFTSAGCTICAGLRPGLRALEREYTDVALREVDHGPDTTEVFRSFNVASTPYFVTVDRRGIVQGRGVANNVEQVEELLEESTRVATDG
jgi:hypothetical protein